MKRMIFAVMIILACAMLLTGCKKANFGVAVNEDNTATIEAVRAPKDYFGGAGSLEVGEGQKLFVEYKLDGKGEISLKFTGSDLGIDAEMSELTETLSGENAVLEITVKGTGSAEYDLAPGSYFLTATVLEKASGTVQISVR